MVVATYRKSFVTVLVLLLVSVHEFHCLCLNCRIPPNASEQQIKELFLLDFKQRLLKKLGLTKEPKNVARLPSAILKAISRQGMLAGDEARPSPQPPTKVIDIILQPVQTIPNIAKNMFSCTFKCMDMRLRNYELDAVKLWLHLKSRPTKKHWFQVYDRRRWGRHLLLNHTISSYTPEWLEVKIQPNKDWRRTPWKKLNLEFVRIKNNLNIEILSSNGNNVPRLQIVPKLIKKRLGKRRSTPTDDCLPGLCCKHTLMIDVKNSMPWLLVPHNIEAGVCIGKCPNLYRSRLPWTYLAAQSSVNRQPCCVPTKLSPMSAIHWDNGTIVTELVQDMIVDSCGCT